MDNGFRDKETLTRKDMVFAAVNVLAAEDKRSMRGIDRLAYVLKAAQALCDWVKNGGANNGSASPHGFECKYCPATITLETAYQWQDSEDGLVLACKRCFLIYGVSEEQVA